MKTAVLLPLLLLGSLQAAIAPATPPFAPDQSLRFRDSLIESPLSPGEAARTFKRLSEAPRTAVVGAADKFQKGIRTELPGIAGAGGGAASLIGVAGHADAESIELRPRLPRAPPAAPPC